MSHTPGPWKLDTYHDGSIKLVLGPGNEMVMSDGLPSEQEAADAHLIVTAPVLLAACKQAAGVLEFEDFPSTLDQLQFAIAKAEGRE